LEKKSKLRNLFEKNKDTICVPFYPDNNQTLNTLINNFFREKKISISQQLINLLVERCRGNRQNLKNELSKIDSFTMDKKNINLDQIIKLTNLAENYNVSELVDSCLAKNFKKTVNILNENNFSSEDCILIIRTLLNKTKRLHGLLLEVNNNKNFEKAISSYKPPIFWKDKEVVKQQISNWDLNDAENLIYQASELELTVKKNYSNAINILSDFIIYNSSRVNS
jgi:DNA polymerase-3 subunit delta